MGQSIEARDLPDRRRGGIRGEEELRFIRNFHDVFLSIGLAMFAAGLGAAGALFVGRMAADLNTLDGWRDTAWLSSGTSFVNGAIMWLLAELFARRRRLFLPAIVILLAFSTFVLSGVGAAYVALFSEQQIDDWRDAGEQLRRLPMVLSGSTAFAILLFYMRMKLPFAMGLGALSLTALAISYYGFIEPEALVTNGFRLMLGAGLFMFFLGVFFDARDPERRTRLSDNAFWLHFFAAPLIFISVMSMTTGGAGWMQIDNIETAYANLAIVVFFALVSLLLNRRALLVSGLLTAAVAIGVIVSRTGLDGAWTAALTLLLLGGAMVLLGGGWHAARRVITAPFPKRGLIARIIPPEPAPDALDEKTGPQNDQIQQR